MQTLKFKINFFVLVMCRVLSVANSRTINCTFQHCFSIKQNFLDIFFYFKGLFNLHSYTKCSSWINPLKFMIFESSSNCVNVFMYVKHMYTVFMCTVYV